MRRPPRLDVVVLAFVAVTATGCEARLELGQRCTFASQCPAGLVCGVGGRCRQACLTSRDCHVGERCLHDETSGVNVCSLGTVDDCSASAPCVGALTCAGGVCVNTCAEGTECPDGRCVAGRCTPIVSGSDGGPAPDASTADAGSCASGRCVRDVSAGYGHVCAVLGDGSLYCWGDASGLRLGDGALDHGSCVGCAATPVRVLHGDGTPVNDAVSVACGDAFSCYLDDAGHVHCWGVGDEHQLGDGRGLSTEHPDTSVLDATGTLLGGVDALVVGRANACALRGDETLCWGRNTDRQLVLAGPDTLMRATPSPLSRPALSARFSIGLTSAGRGALGAGPHGEVGSCALTPLSAVAERAGAIERVAASDTAACELVGGAARCWGDVTLLFGAAAATDVCDVNVCLFDPLAVPTATTLGPRVGLAGDWQGYGFCAWDAAGAVECWGPNDRRVVEDSAVGSYPNARARADLPPVVRVTIGANAACARTLAGELLCWGANEYGQLGRGSTSYAEGLPRAVSFPP